MTATTISPILRLGSRAPSVRELQELLNKAGATLTVDGHFGPATGRALRQFQSRMGLTVDGIAGRQTWATLRGVRPTVPVQQAPARPVSGAVRFPAVPRSQVGHVFGPPGSPRAEAGRCLLPFPHVLAWNLSEQIRQFRCHELIAPVMTWVFAEAAKHYGEAQYRLLRLDRWAGCFNPRRVRGGSAWSIHAYGVAVDIDSERNGLHTPTASSPLARPEYADYWRIVEASGGLSFGKRHGRDWMHWSYVQE